VCPSQASTVPTRLKAGSRKQRHDAKDLGEIPTG